MARQTSILKFFNKSPKSSSLILNDDKSKINNSKQNDDTKENSKPKKHKFDLYEIIWARLDGYPHWPAIICNHPGLKTYFKTVKNCEYLNVQFFDNPPQRAWIKVDDCILLENDNHPTIKKISDNSLQNSIQWSLEVLKKNKQERSKIIIKFPLSDEEEEKEEDFDSSISDQLSPLNKSTRIKAKRKLESEGDEISLSNKKKILVDSDDSEDDYQPDKSLSTSSDSESENISDVSSQSEPDDDDEVDEDEIIDSSKSKKKAIKTTKVNLNKISENLGSQNEEGESLDIKEWRHLKLDFLKPENIKDKEGRRPDHPDYDPSTLWVPPNFIKNETPAHQQWWKIKCENFDVVLFFKMGKFYELFHMDAVILCNEANLIYMKGDYAHSGFPEIAFQRFANLLIQKGYKVARIEQTETPEQRDERCKNNSKQSKVVKREVCRVTSLGTKSLLEFSDVTKKTHLSFLYSITEKELSDNQVLTGLSFVDATVGEFYLIQFIDDKYLSTLRTIISHYPPIEILLEKDNVTSNTLQTIKAVVPNVATTTLRTDKEFWKPREVLKFLMEGPYFKVIKEDTEKFEIPEEFKKVLDESDVLNLTVKKDYELCLKALGAIVFQLKRHLIEEDLLSLRKFKILDSDFFTTNNNDDSNADFMVLDSVTIKNLELFENCIGTTEATLIEAIDFCVTKFGKRLLRNWICSPLCRKEEIENRLDAVTELMKLNLLDLHKSLENLPDLERILCKIHAQSLAHRSKNHPDSRAVLFEANTYNKSKINEFCNLLESFKTCDKFIKEIRKLSPDPSSKFLSYLISYKEDGGYFPNSNFILSYFDNAFDHKVAKEKGIIIPKKGVNKLYEKANENIASVIKDLDNYLKEVSIKVGAKIKYFGKGKNRYQLEVPENVAKKIDKEFELTSSRKGFKRYQSEKIKNLLNDLKKYEEDKEEAMQESLRLIFESFIGHSEEWRKIIEIVAILDCLISFCIYSKSLKSKGIYSRPKILDYKGQSLIKVKNGLHPVLMNVVDNFMPNDIELDQKLMLLTGPNMGGKSTLMRQTGLLVLLAHIGCHVPAESLECTLIDRIFTRLGATDRILEGESTFYVELSETSTIIRNATSRSLVLLDELGRGTSTYDGTSIACSVVNYLCNNIKCLTMFSTHYSSLLEEFKVEDNIIFSHMACVVENEDYQDPTNECITFLYKLVPGPCPKSYGFNAAKLSDIPDDVIKCGFEKAKKLESKVESVKLLTKLINKTISSKEAKLLINYLKNYN